MFFAMPNVNCFQWNVGVYVLKLFSESLHFEGRHLASIFPWDIIKIGNEAICSKRAKLFCAKYNTDLNCTKKSIMCNAISLFLFLSIFDHYNYRVFGNLTAYLPNRRKCDLKTLYGCLQGSRP